MPRHRKLASIPLTGGGSYNFYDPDIRLSQQLAVAQGQTTGATQFPKSAMYQEIATRETAWNYYRVLGFLPNPEPILRKMGKDVDEFRSLLSDSRVKACFNSRRGGILSMSWSLDQDESQTRVYDAVESMLKGWNLREIMADLCQATWYGYQPAEVLWKREGGQIIASNLVTKDVSWFRYSDINELRYLTKRNMITGEPVPPKKFVVSRHHPSYWNPYGESLAAACYWPTKFKHSGYRFAAVFMEKYGMPWIQVNYPLGTQEARVREMVDIIAGTMQDGIIAYPDSMKAEALDMNKTASADIYEWFISLCNTEIEMAILGQNLTTEVKGGSFAASKSHMQVRQDLIDEDCRMIEDTINTVIQWYVELNWGVGKAYPKFRLTPQSAPSLDDAKLALTLSQAGVKLQKEYYSKRFAMVDTEFDVGDMPQVGIAAMKTQPGEPQAEATSTDDKEIAAATAEAKDPSTNSATYDAVKRVRGGKAY